MKKEGHCHGGGDVGRLLGKMSATWPDDMAWASCPSPRAQLGGHNSVTMA